MQLNVNGKQVEVAAEDSASLLFVLRDTLNLTGTKFGCGGGYCGACTVLVDGSAVRTCVTSISSVKGKKVVTIEGLSNAGAPDVLQQAFIDLNAAQCGFCIPGIVMAAKDLLDHKKNPSESEIRSWLNMNLCRCGTHVRIIKAVKLAAKRMAGEK